LTSNAVSTEDILEVFTEEATNKRGIDPAPIYDYGSDQGASAWHAVSMARAGSE
jgi:hypothetical protein